MSKIVAFIIAGGLVLAALAAFNINSVNAREETKFVQFSVLAEDRANYGVDENSSPIPAVSIDIIEDKLHDSGLTSTIPVIKYTYLPPQTPKSAHHNNSNESQTVNQSEPHGNHENNGNGSSVNNGNAGGNQNQNANGAGSSSQNNRQQKEKGKETRTDKGSSSNSGSSGNTSASSQDKNKSNTSQTK